MSNLDDLKDELEFELTMKWGLNAAPALLAEAVEVGLLMLDAGATYGEALAAAKLRLQRAA